ncbi:MAG: hypothetical protein Q4A74_04215 [Cardiobacteriaceae bacterium]|nr:hypothetical protein [Cardiobacteriaceae bacterium]
MERTIFLISSKRSFPSGSRYLLDALLSPILIFMPHDKAATRIHESI